MDVCLNSIYRLSQLCTKLWPDLQKGTTSVKRFVTWVLNKLLLKHLKHLGFVYIQLVHMHNYSTCMQNCLLLCFNSVFFHKSGHNCCDRSGHFLQIRSQLINMQWHFTQFRYSKLNFHRIHSSRSDWIRVYRNLS